MDLRIEPLVARSADPLARAVAIGNFDGVHLGHQEILRRCALAAHDVGGASAVLTFDPHPAAVVSPDGAPPRIQTRLSLERRLRETGIADLASLAFDENVARLTPSEFVERVLVNGLRARAVVVGEGFRFGARRSGDVGELRRIGNDRFRVVEAPSVSVHGQRVSSSRVRGALATGDLEGAAALLGRRYEIEGLVVHGDHRGRELGYPTANVDLGGVSALADGIYAADAFLPDDPRPRRAAVSLGVRPTFAGADRRLEAFLVGFEGDLYGRNLRLVFLARLRDEAAFSSVETLKEQIARDVASAVSVGTNA